MRRLATDASSSLATALAAACAGSPREGAVGRVSGACFLLCRLRFERQQEATSASPDEQLTL